MLTLVDWTRSSRRASARQRRHTSLKAWPRTWLCSELEIMSPVETLQISRREQPPPLITGIIYWYKMWELLFFKNEKHPKTLSFLSSFSDYLKAHRREKLRNWKRCCATLGEWRRQVSMETSFIMFQRFIISFLSRADTVLFLPYPTHPRAQRSCYVHKANDKQSSKLGKVSTVLHTAVLAKCYFTGSVTLLPQLLKALTSDSISVHRAYGDMWAKSHSPGWLWANVSRTVPLLLITAGFNISQLKTIIFFMLFSNLAPRNSWLACTSPVREPLRKMDMGCCR